MADPAVSALVERIQARGPAGRKFYVRSIDLLRKTLSMLTHYVWTKELWPGEHMWSIPVDQERDFDCILSDAIDELEELREAASRLSSEGRSGYGETIGESPKVVMFKGVEFVNASPNEITLEPEGPMRMVIRASTPPASPAATTGAAELTDDEIDVGVTAAHRAGFDTDDGKYDWRSAVKAFRETVGLSAASRPAQAWQPIESAPFDTSILVYRPDTTDTVVGFRERHEGHGRTFTCPGHWQIPATHWMPLPAPPSTHPQQEKEQEMAFDDEPDDFYPDDDDGYCDLCGGEGWILTCGDDICHGCGYCIHGDGMEMCSCNTTREPPSNAPREWKWTP